MHAPCQESNPNQLLVTLLLDLFLGLMEDISVAVK
jgi:hypothetical protein